MVTPDVETYSGVMVTSDVDTYPGVMVAPDVDTFPGVMVSPDVDITPQVTPMPYWQGKVQTCPGCDRRILQRFFSVHTQSCKPAEVPPVMVDSTPAKTGTQLETVPEFSLDDRTNQLNKFEVLLLTPNQEKEFNSLFSAKKLDVNEPIFHSWLSLKLASIPTEAEALARVLTAHTVGNVPKRKQKRIQNLPTGAARYDPSSPEWVSVLVEQENKKKKQPQKKATAVAAKSKQNKSAGNPPPRVNNSKSKTAKKKLRI